jgi:glycosyltransferase involved in cell wall biosynthesis
MKILLIHNKYQQAGGEDAVFHAEEQMLSQNRHLVETLVFQNDGLKTFWDKLRAGLAVIYNAASARAVRSKILEFGPDVIHVHNFFPIASPSIFFAAREFNVPVVVTLHNYRLICPSATLYNNNRIYEDSVHTVCPLKAIVDRVYRHSFFQTAAVVLMTTIHSLLGTWRNKIALYIALTQFSKGKFLEAAIGIPAEKLVVKPNFVSDCGRGQIARENYFLYVGRLTEEKGIRTLLEATERLSFRLVIIGDGPLKSLVTAFAANNPNIHYLGFQRHEVVLKHMKECKALIFPSLWYEGFPITLVEALCTGTVVIASELGSMAEIIEDGVNGLHFQPGNAGDLVRRLGEVNSQPEQVRSLSAKARLTYLDRFTPEENCAMLIGIYKRAAAGVRQVEERVIYSVHQGWYHHD